MVHSLSLLQLSSPVISLGRTPRFQCLEAPFLFLEGGDGSCHLWLVKLSRITSYKFLGEQRSTWWTAFRIQFLIQSWLELSLRSYRLQLRFSDTLCFSFREHVSTTHLFPLSQARASTSTVSDRFIFSRYFALLKCSCESILSLASWRHTRMMTCLTSRSKMRSSRE